MYEESITITIGLTKNMNCSVYVTFTVSSLNGPFSISEFTSGPSFVSLYVYSDPHIIQEVYWETSTSIYTFHYPTKVIICLNMSKLTDFNQGKIKADALKRKVEDLLKIFLFLDEHLSQFTIQGVAYYYYLSEVPAVEKLWNTFLKQEYSGFSEPFSSNPSIGPSNMQLRIKKIDDQYLWTHQIVGFGMRFPISLNKEYVVSLNEVLGHVGAISSAPSALSSNIVIQVFAGNGNWTFAPLEVMPEMTKTVDTPKQITFQTDIAGSSYNDIKIWFKVIESSEDMTNMYLAAAISGILFCTAGIPLSKRRKPKSYRYRS
ncbi:MAG: hypothetical protein QXZ70_00140 [Candidatus Bathyarchaeia archaeon]